MSIVNYLALIVCFVSCEKEKMVQRENHLNNNLFRETQDILEYYTKYDI
jgi:hypothetical protein